MPNEIIKEEEIEEIELSDSSSEVHPNIDKKSYKNWKRQMAAQHKKELKERLDLLNRKESLTEEEKKELEKIKALILPKYVSVNDEGSFRTSKDETDKDGDYADELIDLLNNTTLEKFIEIVSTQKIDLGVFEDFVLYNLSENIKEGNDDVGFKLSKISLFIGYVKNNGPLLVSRLCDELKNPDKFKIFEDDVKKYYDESKNAILNLKY